MSRFSKSEAGAGRGDQQDKNKQISAADASGSGEFPFLPSRPLLADCVHFPDKVPRIMCLMYIKFHVLTGVFHSDRSVVKMMNAHGKNSLSFFLLTEIGPDDSLRR